MKFLDNGISANQQSSPMVIGNAFSVFSGSASDGCGGVQLNARAKEH
jgi:hypothetical protein